MLGGNLGRQSESLHLTFTESTFPMLELSAGCLGKTQVFFFFWKGPFTSPGGSRAGVTDRRGWAGGLSDDRKARGGT